MGNSIKAHCSVLIVNAQLIVQGIFIKVSEITVKLNLFHSADIGIEADAGSIDEILLQNFGCVPSGQIPPIIATGHIIVLDVIAGGLPCKADL